MDTATHQVRWREPSRSDLIGTGIKLRAPEGIDAIDYLSRSKPFKSHSTVFGTVISNLEDLGYNDTNMVAAPVIDDAIER